MKINLNKMFGNKSKESSYSEDAKTSFRASGSSEKVLTLISAGCKFEGNLSSPSTTKIDGHVVGNLRGESGIVIGEKGIVEGNINAVDVLIYGRVKGNVKSHKLEIRRTGALDGDIIVEELATETGSKFNGNCRMGEDKKSNIIDMKDTNIKIETETQPKENPVLKFH